MLPAMIERLYHPRLDLIEHRVEGELSEREFVDATRALYAMDPPPRFSLWDLEKVVWAGSSYEDTRKMQASLVGEVRGREGGKTALVVPADFGYALGRQYIGLAESYPLPFEQRVFRSRAEALEWLGVSERQLEAS
ncbi:MAG: hypothetical protein DWQ36_08170 [Acidobacteria bacterium]|nr:MAG: hypothetical protein DWQ30_01895 [Acidobacteriota bacterium]REK08784.1 MAG: hypothetical protein DWQ36_08170 [Acidobacteriota bacterium]